MQLHPYLTFSGNCREALNFYQQSLGGQVYFQTVGESPMADQLPQEMKDCVLHAVLMTDQFMLFATDMVDEDGLRQGNNVSIHLECRDQKEMETCYTKLVQGGVINHPPTATYWGALFGSLTDKFGIHWQMNLGNTYR